MHSHMVVATCAVTDNSRYIHAIPHSSYVYSRLFSNLHSVIRVKGHISIKYEIWKAFQFQLNLRNTTDGWTDVRQCTVLNVASYGGPAKCSNILQQSRFYPNNESKNQHIGVQNVIHLEQTVKIINHLLVAHGSNFHEICLTSWLIMITAWKNENKA